MNTQGIKPCAREFVIGFMTPLAFLMAVTGALSFILQEPIWDDVMFPFIARAFLCVAVFIGVARAGLKYNEDND